MLPGIHQKFEPQHTPAFFARGPSPLVRGLFFSLLSVFLIAADGHWQFLTPLRQHLITLLHPLQVVANAPTQLYHHTQRYFSRHHVLLDENNALKQSLLQKNMTLQQLTALTIENTHLRQLLQASPKPEVGSTLAEIMYMGRDSFSKKVVIDRGSDHHIMAGEAVADATGVIGQVTHTTPLSSEVTLITDKSQAVPIQVERNGLRAIAFGRGGNALELLYLSADVDVRQGDKLVTSGIDGVYPAGLAVAQVTQVQAAKDSSFAHIVCTPLAGVENHKQVLVLHLLSRKETAH